MKILKFREIHLGYLGTDALPPICKMWGVTYHFYDPCPSMIGHHQWLGTGGVGLTPRVDPGELEVRVFAHWAQHCRLGVIDICAFAGV